MPILFLWLPMIIAGGMLSVTLDNGSRKDGESLREVLTP